MKRRLKMKRIAAITLALTIALSSRGLCLETKLNDMRDKIFAEAKEIKALANQQYLILILSMWDTCFVAISQVDAYAFMLGIFNTIPREGLTPSTVDFLSRWLGLIKATDELNIKGLDAIKVPIEPMIRIHMEKVKRYFKELNNQIDVELGEIAKFRDKLNPLPKPPEKPAKKGKR
jgi:hypothetical protein